jgi:N-acetyl-beta-hexosaminidase
VLEGVLADAASCFPDGHFHWGGDELQAGCWNASKAIVAWMEANGYDGRTAADFVRLEDSFYQQAQALLDDATITATATAAHQQAHTAASQTASQTASQATSQTASQAASQTASQMASQAAEAGAAKRSVVWEEVFFPPPSSEWVDRSSTFAPNATVVETWTGPSFLPEATSRGYDALLAYGW